MENQVQSSDIPEISYKAFISYRHLALDKEAAERIQKGIEHYIVPKEFRHLSGGKKLGKVFRDEDELPISSNLSDSITYALDHTEYLIVICTPDLPKSRWCAQEIRYFLETHDRNHIIAVLADGSPEESFSPYLLHEYDEEGNITADLEPLAANMAGEGHKLDPKSFSKEMMRIRAALLGVPFDSLWQRERRRRMVQIASGMAVIMAGLAVFLGVTLNKNAQIRRQNEQISEQNAQISEQNTQILSQNEEINEKNISMQKQLSSMLVDAGNGLLEEFDTRGAIANGLAAIENDDPAIYDHRAEQLLLNALGAFSTGEMTGELIHEQTTDIVDIAVPLHKDRVYLADLVGNISCLDINSGKLDREGYISVAKKLTDRFNFKGVAITLRESLSANDNNWSAMLYTSGQAVFSKKYAMHIVDRVGGGDSFGAGLIYSLVNNYEPQKAIEFAVAASCLKHSIEGDYNMVSIKEVEALAGGNASGRVQR